MVLLAFTVLEGKWLGSRSRRREEPDHEKLCFRSPAYGHHSHPWRWDQAVPEICGGWLTEKRELAVKSAKVYQCAQSKCDSKHFAKILLSFVFSFLRWTNTQQRLRHLQHFQPSTPSGYHMSYIMDTISCSSSLYHAQVPYTTRFCTHYIIPA